MMMKMKMNVSLLFAVILCTASLVHGLSLNSEVRHKIAAKNGRAVQPNRPLVNTLDAEMSADDGDDSALFYSDLPGDEKDADQTPLDTLMLDIIQGSTNGSAESDLSNCQQSKAQIADICMTKFVQRTRFRPEWEVPAESADKATTPLKRLASTLASPQQICCELKITYMRCLLTNLNPVCSLTELNSEYDRMKGLSEICTRFFSKSSKKCRRRYRNKTSQVDSSSTVTASVSVADGGSSNSTV